MPTAPVLDLALARLLDEVIAHTDTFTGLPGKSILPVFLGAHGTVAASVRSLDDCAQSVRIARQPRRIELGLRPPFFRSGDAARRLATLVHELLHLDPAQPGALLEAHRHKNRSHDAHEAEARDITRDLLRRLDPASTAPLAHHGPVTIQTWVTRPVPKTAARRFSARDLMPVVVEMKTPRATRSVWW